MRFIEKTNQKVMYLEDESVEKEPYRREEHCEERQTDKILVSRERFVFPVDRFHRFEETHLGKFRTLQSDYQIRRTHIGISSVGFDPDSEKKKFNQMRSIENLIDLITTMMRLLIGSELLERFVALRKIERFV